MRLSNFSNPLSTRESRIRDKDWNHCLLEASPHYVALSQSATMMEHFCWFAGQHSPPGLKASERETLVFRIPSANHLKSLSWFSKDLRALRMLGPCRIKSFN